MCAQVKVEHPVYIEVAKRVVKDKGRKRIMAKGQWTQMGNDRFKRDMQVTRDTKVK